jgi:hypothetical protein
MGFGFCILQRLRLRFFEGSCAVLRLILFWTILLYHLLYYLLLVVVGDWYLASIFLVLRVIGRGATS